MNVYIKKENIDGLCYILDQFIILHKDEPEMNKYDLKAVKDLLDKINI